MRKGILGLALVAVLVATAFGIHKEQQSADPGTGGRYLVSSQDKTL